MRRIIPVLPLVIAVLLTSVYPALAACSGTGCAVNDAFNRAVASGFGSAPTGGAYTMTWENDGSSANSTAFVDNTWDEGEIGLTANASVETVTAQIGTTSWDNYDILVKLHTHDELSSSAGIVLRAQDYNSFYVVEYFFQPGATSSIRIRQDNNGSWTTLNSGNGFTFALDTDYYIRARVSGSEVKVKWWEAGDSEPTGSEWDDYGWMATYSSLAWSAGKPGVFAQVVDAAGGSSTAVDTGFTEFSVLDCDVHSCTYGAAYGN